MAVNALYSAKVFHKRLRPRENAFTYNVHYLCFALGEEGALRSSLMSLERFNLFSFYRKDHGARDGSELLPWIRGVLARFGVTQADGDVVLVTHPRVLGYVFNPVSFWFCLDREKRLRAVLAEVNNTFGQHHSYLLFHPDQRPIEPGDTLTSDKVFHVSPFMHVEGLYRFRFSYSEQSIGVWLDYDVEGEPMLKTSLTGKRHPLTAIAMTAAFFNLPFVAFKTIVLIHWQALKLVVKRIRYVPKPALPEQEIT